MAELFRNLTLLLMTEKCFDKFFMENEFLDGEENGEFYELIILCFVVYLLEFLECVFDLFSAQKYTLLY